MSAPTVTQAPDRPNGMETKVIHAGEPKPRFGGAICLPIFQSSIFEVSEGVDYHDIPYIRLSNTPNHVAVQEKLAALESAEAALVTGSGMAAIATTLLSVLSHGDHLLVQRRLYGGSYTFITHMLPRFGIAHDFIDSTAPSDWVDKIRPNTKAIYVETISNPTADVPDLPAVVAFAKSHDLVSLIDNTVASPMNFRPPELGFDLSLHSCTKYLNGHTDIVAGAVIGRADLVEQVRRDLNHLGGILDPHACNLLHRGIKTLAVRMRYHNDSAMAIARFLESHSAVTTVNYPGLSSHPSHDRAREALDGYSGLLSFEVDGDGTVAQRVMERMHIPILTGSLGGVESLVSRPATLSHVGMTPEERAKAGVSDNLIRLSVGLESTDDLIEDLERALSQ